MEPWPGNVFLVCLLVLGHGKCPCTAVVDPITLGVAGAGLAGMYAIYENVKCRINECCNAHWIKPNMSALQHALDSRLHGQHLVKKTVVTSLSSHLRRVNPSKALVLSFHGWTGGGKNYVSQMIAEHLFIEGVRSRFVHLFIATLHFPHRNLLNEYKDNLVNWIRGNITLCERSVFIFDEMDKMPPGLIDSIKPFLDYHQHINEQNYRRGIFIFLSNTGGSDITRMSLQAWKDGKTREAITMKDMESLITQGAFNEEGGLKRSDIIEKNLIDFYVPFLPLERRHVKLCIRDELHIRNLPAQPELIDRVADELAYYPDRVYLYSKTGCKHAAQKLDFILED